MRFMYAFEPLMNIFVFKKKFLLMMWLNVNMFLQLMITILRGCEMRWWGKHFRESFWDFEQKF